MKALLALVALPVALWAQSGPPPLIGTVTAVDAAAYSITVKEDKTGVERTVLLQDTRTLLKVQPGAKTLEGAARISADEIGVGDRVDVRGPKLYGNPNAISARSLVLMSGDELCETLGAAHQDVPSPRVQPPPDIDPFQQSSSFAIKGLAVGMSTKEFAALYPYLWNRKHDKFCGVRMRDEQMSSLVSCRPFGLFVPDDVTVGGALVVSHEVAFSGGVVSRISYDFIPVQYAKLLLALTDKFGAPQKLDSLKLRNGLGNEFSSGRAAWEDDTSLMVLTEIDPDEAANPCTLGIYLRSSLDKAKSNDSADF